MSNFTFDSSEGTNNILNFKYLGTVKKVLTPVDFNKGTEELVFPLCSFIRGRKLPSSEMVDIDRILAKKMTPLMINTNDDNEAPLVYGMVTRDNDVLIVSDFNNKIIKVFSADKLLSSLKLLDPCYHVSVAEDAVAIVRAGKKENSLPGYYRPFVCINTEA